MGLLIMNGKREYGDYQTPIDFAVKVCLYLKNQRRIAPSAVVEPTCGVGNFLKGSLIFKATEYYGIELNKRYCEICRDNLHGENITIIHANFFSFSTRKLVKDSSQILVIGNPPWVTNSTLSMIQSQNIPPKENFKGLKGIEAITGASNFDICEYIILQLVEEYKGTNTIISMLCKTSVARNIYRELHRTKISFTAFDIIEFDAMKVFGISASACMLFLQLSQMPALSSDCCLYDFDNPTQVNSKLGYIDDLLYSKLDNRIHQFDGKSCFEWRQGVKHDCSKIMELTVKQNSFQNGFKHTVTIEHNIVFPLVKSSMFKTPVINRFSKFVIVTQRKPREETKHIKEEYPKTWEYLNENIIFFQNRKSSIYRGAPDFSMFGIGEYSYSVYKVGVSGFYKRPLFSVLYSEDKKPVMTDDTSYFICFDNYDMAYVAMLLLNSDEVQDFLGSIAFLDAKRPYTKKVLERIDFNKIVSFFTFRQLVEIEEKLNLSHYITISMYNKFASMINDMAHKYDKVS